MKLKSAFLFLTLTIGMSSCAFMRLATSGKMKVPTFAYVRCEVKSVTPSQTNVDFILSSYNPNEVGLKNVSVSYELFNEGKRFLKGNDVRIELSPKDTTRIVIPAEIVYREIINVIGPAAEKVLLGSRTIPVRIDAVISGDPTLYNSKEEGSLIPFSLKVSRTEEIPIPQDQINRAKSRALDQVMKRF